MALPPEVWEDVIKETSLSDLTALARVSPSFRVMATDRLYESIELSYGTRECIRCLTTLCSNTLAARSVKKLYILDFKAAPVLRSFFSLAIRAFSALCNLRSITYICMYATIHDTLYPPATAEILTHCTFPCLENIDIPGSLGLACFKKHQKTLRRINVHSETSNDTNAQTFEHQFDFPVLEHITLSQHALPPFLSNSHLPSLNSIMISLWTGISMDNLEAIRAFLAGPRSGTQIEQFKLGLCVRSSANIWVIDMISIKLPGLASLEVYGPSIEDLDLVEETIGLIIPMLGRFTQLQRLVWNWEDPRIWEGLKPEKSYTDQLHAYVLNIGSRCPALRACAIVVAWKRIVHGLWVPDNVPLRVQAAQWVFDKIRSESGYPGLIEHLETYSGSNARVKKALFEYQTIQDDYKRIMPLMRVGEELGLWAFSPGFEAEINTTVDRS